MCWQQEKLWGFCLENPVNLSGYPNRDVFAAPYFSLQPRSDTSSVGSLSHLNLFCIFFSTNTIVFMQWSVCRADFTGCAYPNQMLFPDNFWVNLQKMYSSCQLVRYENSKCRRWFFRWQRIFSKAHSQIKISRQDTAIIFSYLDKA